MKRRDLLVGAAAVAASGGGVALWLQRKTPLAEGPSSPALAPAGVFPKGYALTLGALSQRLLPAAAGFPGAAALGVIDFLQAELLRPELENVKLLVFRGAAQLDRVARALGGKSFRLLDEAAQDEVVRALSRGEGARRGFDPHAFLRAMMALTLEGAFCDPAHGGNRDEQGWRWLGYAVSAPRPGACVGGECGEH